MLSGRVRYDPSAVCIILYSSRLLGNCLPLFYASLSSLARHNRHLNPTRPQRAYHPGGRVSQVASLSLSRPGAENQGKRNLVYWLAGRSSHLTIVEPRLVTLPGSFFAPVQC